jgi:hypothetical protein
MMRSDSLRFPCFALLCVCVCVLFSSLSFGQAHTSGVVVVTYLSGKPALSSEAAASSSAASSLPHLPEGAQVIQLVATGSQLFLAGHPRLNSAVVVLSKDADGALLEPVLVPRPAQVHPEAQLLSGRLDMVNEIA